MNSLRISEKIIRLRHERGITQEHLANYLGVTKASVSKWETKQSYPDILLLPQIATFFDVSMDQLFGYEPQLSKEQIKKVYEDLTDDFVNISFDEAMGKSEELVKNYYSCYPLLLQIALLWLNHFMIGETPEKQQEVLNKAHELCEHITKDCDNIGISSDAQIVKATIDLQLGKAQDVVDSLEPLNDQKQLKSQIDGILLQAYVMTGNIDKAQQDNQIMTYTHLLILVSNARGRISLNLQDAQLCDETIRRTLGLMNLYNVDKLHPNVSLQFHFQCAVYYAVHGQKEKTLEILRDFVYRTVEFLDKGVLLHGDDYFDKLDQWFEEFNIGTSMPRKKEIVIDGVVKAMKHPAFAGISQEKEFETLLKYLEERGK